MQNNGISFIPITKVFNFSWCPLPLRHFCDRREITGWTSCACADQSYSWKRIGYYVVFACYMNDVWSVLAYEWEFTLFFVWPSLLVAVKRTKDVLLIDKNSHISRSSRSCYRFTDAKIAKSSFLKVVILFSALNGFRQKKFKGRHSQFLIW